MSLQSEVLLNGYDNNLRELFDIILKHNIYNKLSYKHISDNIFFKEKYTDILAIGTVDDIEELIKKGYEEVEYEKYTNTIVNSTIKTEEVTDYKLKHFNNYIDIGNDKITYSFKDNIVNINGNSPYRLIKSIEYDFKIDEFIIDDEGFVYIRTGNTLIKTHIALNFFRDYLDHSCVTKLEDIEKLYVIELDNPTRILDVDDYSVTYLKKGNLISKTELGRKYYFIKDGQVFFNVIDNTDKITVQVEHTHFYDWLSILGLNKYKVDGKKLNTKYIDRFKNIIKFHFDSTLNGMLNYNDFTEDKSYKVDKDIGFVKIEGNFNYKYEKGKYKLVLRADKTYHQLETKFHIDLLRDGECLKRLTGNTVNMIMYFCNLKFIFYKYEYDTNIEIDIEVTDDYTIKLINEFRDIDEKFNISNFDDIFKTRKNSIKHQIVESDYDKGFFIVKNYIKNSKERNFNDDFRIKLIEKDGTPSMLWHQIKPRNYFLRLKNYLVKKVIKPKRHEEKLFNVNQKEFSLHLDKIINKTGGLNENI